jgi:molybdopterin/thiamine biosynthesis adenylyltransferase
MPMAGQFHHEELYRGRELVEKLAAVQVTLCGAGALGSNLADNLVRQGARRLRVIDRDRVEEHNIGTQIYGEGDVGAPKVDVLKNRLFRAAGVDIDAVHRELSDKNVRKLFKDAGLVVDTFDNSASRRLVQSHCAEHGVACLHAGLFADYGEVVWNDQYRVPGDAGQDVCDYPLARNLVLLTVAVASETLLRFVLGGVRESWSITLGDFAISRLEAAAPAP